jgi:drug/metabolite transporter (DMT)-like permease
MGIKQRNVQGYILALTAAMLWGVSGTCCQYLFQQRQFNPEWLVTVRLLTAGALLLLFAAQQKQTAIWEIWKSRPDALQLIIFGIAGMLAVQYTYFAAIHASNAATATILQYLGPVIIACYVAVRNKKPPAPAEIAAIVLALCGTFLLVTHGSVQSLSISGAALFWGITSAFALAFYTVQPVQLLHKWPAAVIIGWAMMLGGVAFSFVHQPWHFTGRWDGTALLLTCFIILLGSLVAFYAFLISVKYIGAVKASLLACSEPLAAALIAVGWLKVPFGWYDWTGACLIIATVILLSVNKPAVAGQ